MVVNEKKLNELLKRKGITKSGLCNQLGISSRTIAKISKGEDINNNVVLKILLYLNASFEDLMSFNYVLQRFQNEKQFHINIGLYRDTQINFAYWANKLVGGRISKEQTSVLYDKHCLDETFSDIKLDELNLIRNCFLNFDAIIDWVSADLSLNLFQLFYNNLSFGVYKSLYNPKFCNNEKIIKLQKIIQHYNQKENPAFEQILDLHYDIVNLDMFDDFNHLIALCFSFKECLKNNFIPFFINDNNKDIYFRGLSEWKTNKQTLFLASKITQENFSKTLDVYNVKY